MDNQFHNFEKYIKFVSASRILVDKDKLICDLCRGKDILDIGCLDYHYEIILKLGGLWLHRKIKDVARSLTGIDILKGDIEKLNAVGFNIIEANAENFNLNKTFDIIVVADVVEHLSNVGLFLANLQKHMRADSLCIITTPNPFNIEQSMQAIFQNQIAVNREHTCWLDPRVMYETISRTGLEITGFYWIKTRFKIPVSRRYLPVNLFSKIIMKLRPICRRDYAVILKKK